MKHREIDGITSCPKVAKLLAIKEAEELIGDQINTLSIDEAVNLLVITAQSIMLSEERIRQIELGAYWKVREKLQCRNLSDLFVTERECEDDY